MNLIIIKFICLIFFIGGYNCQYFPIDEGGSCQKYIGDSPNLQLCDGFLSNPNSIYINSTSTQQEIQDQGNLVRLYISVKTVESCKNSTSTYALLCAFLFPECSEHIDPITQKKIAYPIFPCNRNCLDMTSNCQISSKLNCAMKYTSDGVSFPVFPKNNTVYKYDNTNFTDTCLDTSKIEYTPPDIQKCFAPLVYHVTTDQAYDESIGYIFPTANASCVVQCPAPLYYKYQWENLYRLSDSLSIISFFLTLFLIITLGFINPKISKFDKINLALITSISLQSFSGALMAFHGSENTLCPEEGRFASHIDNVCVASAFILHGTSLLVVQWWCIMSFEIWITIFQVGKKQKDRFIYYCIATMIISWIPPIVSISKNQYSGGPGNPFCWLTNDINYQKYAFWTPLGIFLCLGGIFLILLIREIYVIVSSNQSKSDKNTRLKILKMEIKPMISLVMYFSILLYVFIYDQYIKNNMHIFTDSIPSYAQCLVTSKDATKCLLKAPNIAGFGYFIYSIRVFGIYAFIIYGASKKILHIWKFNYLVLFVSKKIEQFTMASTTAKSSNSNQSSSTTIQNQSSSTVAVSNMETPQGDLDEEESHDSNSQSVELDSED